MTLSFAARPPALVCGIPIADATMAEAIDIIADLIERGRSLRRSHQVATVNVDFLVKAIRDPSILSLLQHADLSLADGTPVVWAARALGTPLPERVAGADLVPALAERASTTGWRIHLYGSEPGTAERAAELLTERHPGVAITGDSGGLIKDVTKVDDAIIDSIREREPDILCVALGNPKQEKFIEANRARLKTPVMIGVGGTLDMLVGSKRRAPLWVQKSGLEWVVRLAQEPRRLLGRYALDAWVFPRSVARQVYLSRRAGSNSRPIIDAQPHEVVITARRNVGAPSADYATAISFIEAGAALRVDVADGGSLRLADLSAMVGMIRHAILVDVPVRIGPVGTTLQQQCESFAVDAFLSRVARIG